MNQLAAALGTLLLFATEGGAARAADVAGPAAEAGATSIRMYAAVEPLSAGEFGLDVSRQLRPWLAVDGMLSAVSVSGDAGGLGHLHARFIAGDKHRFSLGAGPSLLIAESFGKVAFLDLELGYEFRASHGMSFIIATGPTLALNNSGRASCSTRPARGWFEGCFLERESYYRGDVSMRLRLGIGASF